MRSDWEGQSAAESSAQVRVPVVQLGWVAAAEGGWMTPMAGQSPRGPTGMGCSGRGRLDDSDGGAALLHGFLPRGRRAAVLPARPITLPHHLLHAIRHHLRPLPRPPLRLRKDTRRLRVSPAPVAVPLIPSLSLLPCGNQTVRVLRSPQASPATNRCSKSTVEE